MAVGIHHANHVAPSIRKKLAITSPTSGCRSVVIVRSSTQTIEFSLVLGYDHMRVSGGTAPSVLATAVDGSGRLHSPTALSLGGKPQLSMRTETEWNPVEAWTLQSTENSPAPAGMRTTVVHPVDRRDTY
jgi:hypothetical protein